MLKVEYLVFIENQSIKCSDNKTFNHLLQSDPDIQIDRNKLTHKNITVDYYIKSGKVKNTDENYFHLTFTCKEIEKINDFTDLLRAIKSVLHLTNKSPQTLFDGVSLHFSNLAYPLIFEIENLMRKLITKFMLTNVGIDWVKDRVPDDVKNSINSENKDITYLHNVDFIQLKNFLFSENYPSHKENLINTLKKAKDINDIKLEDIKALIPSSNWERYFSEEVDISKEKLSKKWDDLYELRCRIAHNRAFTKNDYESVKTLCNEIKDVISKAIENLDKIDVTEIERKVLTETIARNFNFESGEYIALYNELSGKIYELVNNKLYTVIPEESEPDNKRVLLRDITKLLKYGLIDKRTFSEIRKLTSIRNEIIHNTETLTHEEILQASEKAKELTKLLDGYL